MALLPFIILQRFYKGNSCGLELIHACAVLWLHVCSHHTHTPVGVKGGDGRRSPRVLRHRLLQQDALHQPGDVHVDVAGEALQAGRVASQGDQQLRRTRDLLGGLVVICHSHDDPGETCHRRQFSPGPRVEPEPTDWPPFNGPNEPWRPGAHFTMFKLFVCLFVLKAVYRNGAAAE